MYVGTEGVCVCVCVCVHVWVWVCVCMCGCVWVGCGYRKVTMEVEHTKMCHVLVV